MTAKVVIGASLAPLRRGLSLAKSAVTKAVATMQAAITKMIAVVKKLALAIGATILASVYKFAVFEKGIANVSTMLDKATMKHIPRFTKELKIMSMQFGESTEILSEGLYNVLSSGIVAGKAMGVLTASVKAAKAGLTETSTAAYAITGILNAYSMSADKAGLISDVLFATVKKGQTTFGELAVAIGRVTAIAAPAGVGIEEVGAALATITAQGISTNEAVTGLRAAIVALQGQSKESIELAKAHGVELNVEALATKGLSGMVEGLSKLSKQTLKEIFKEIGARTAINALIAKQTGFLGNLSFNMNAAGQTQEALAKQSKTLSFQFDRLKTTIGVVSKTLGGIFAPAAQKIVKLFLEIGESIDTFLQKHQYAIQEWISDVYDTVSATYTLIKNLWKNGELATAIKGALSDIWDEFVLWGHRLVILFAELGKVAGSAFVKNVIPAVGKGLGKAVLAVSPVYQAIKTISGSTEKPEPQTVKGAVEKAMSFGKKEEDSGVLSDIKDHLKTIVSQGVKINPKWIGLKPAEIPDEKLPEVKEPAWLESLLDKEWYLTLKAEEVDKFNKKMNLYRARDRERTDKLEARRQGLLQRNDPFYYAKKSLEDMWRSMPFVGSMGSDNQISSVIDAAFKKAQPVTAAVAAPSGVGFSGFKEAWFQMAEGFSGGGDDPVVRETKRVVANTAEHTRQNEKIIAKLDGVGTVD